VKKYCRLLLSLLLMFCLTGCEDDVAELSDEAFHTFQFKQGKGEEEEDKATTLDKVKKEHPKYSQEFVWHSSGDSGLPGNRHRVVLIYKTRNGNFYLQFDDGELVKKRKIQYES
jgi:hypothetical protein